MSIDYIRQKTKKDFESAYMSGLITSIFDTLKGRNSSLLSFQDVMKYIKVKNESYKGMQCVRIDLIAGSEGRYNDFNKSFFPKRFNLRNRWQRVDEAHYKDIILPPIKLYKLGKVYFVRDGNHRVSVATKQGREFIDAEVIEIDTHLDIKPGMTERELIEIVTAHEKKIFLKNTGLDNFRDVIDLNFTYPGRYDEILIHVQGHQYFLGIDTKRAVTFEEALLSWYDNLYAPIISEIKKSNISSHFADRTSADLYVWIIRHWDELKDRYGHDVKISDAVDSYKKSYGTHPVRNFFKKFWELLKAISRP